MKQDAKSSLRIIVTGGGTGGHLFPGIAVAEAILARFSASKVLFISPGRKIDRKSLERKTFDKAEIKSKGLKGKSLFSKLQALFLLPMSILESAQIIRKFSPDLVFGVGGYVTGPVILAARFLGIPCCIHEQNSVPGLANKLLGHIVQRIFITFPGSDAYFPKGKTVLSGNPVRHELLTTSKQETTREKKQKQSATLLILGGSQGAHKINVLILEAVEKIQSSLPPGFRIIHQTGEKDEISIQKRYEALGISAQVSAFFTDMAEIYREADLVISRAGATTLSELTVFNKPAVLIPYPYAADNHQEQNGRFIVDNGGAIMFKENELTGETLGRKILDLFNDPATLNRMAESIGMLSKPQALDTIIKESLTLFNKKP